MTEFIATLAGAQFRPKETKDLIKMLSVGDELKLQRDPENQYDSNAIKIFDEDNNWLGFVSKEEAADIAPLLDNGDEATCVVDCFLDTLKPQLKITFGAGEEDDTADEAEEVPAKAEDD